MILIAMAAGGIGYLLGAQRENSLARLEENTISPLDYYMTQESFSEVENAKANLEGLCARFRTEFQTKWVADHESGTNSLLNSPVSEQLLETAIADLARGVKEFAGTDQELEVAQDLLFALKASELFRLSVFGVCREADFCNSFC